MTQRRDFLKKAGGDIDSAETHFLRALEILHKELGEDHEETAIVSNNLGALYQSSGFHEQAREMHMMALEARRKAFGDDPDDAGYPFPVLADAEMEHFRRYRAYDDFEDMPLHGTFLVDGQGRVRWQDVSYEPFMEWEFLLEESQRLLGLHSSPVATVPAPASDTSPAPVEASSSASRPTAAGR